MKILINDCYGGFELSDEFIKAYPQFEELKFSYSYEDRINKELIKAVEKFGLKEASGEYCELDIVEIPHEATDFMKQENDGMESIIYVLNGKIYFA